MQIRVATVGNSMEVPQKIKNGTALWPRDSPSRYVTEGTQNTNSKDCLHPYIHCCIIYNNQAIEATHVPINRQVDKKAIVYLHNDILIDP